MSRYRAMGQQTCKKIACNISMLRGGRRLGTRVAEITIGPLFFWTSWLMTGCLVTESVEFEEEENFPPALYDEPGSQPAIGEAISINRDEQETGEIVFSLQVRDENVLQTLKTRYELSSPLESTSLVEVGPEVGISGEPIRHFEFGIPVSLIRQDYCYRLLLVVTSGFSNELKLWDKPLLDGDVAKARWLIVENGANMDDCPLLPYPGETSQ
jgi:hypothetical protein